MQIYDEPRILTAGEQGLVVELGDGIDPRINGRVHSLATAVAGEDRRHPGSRPDLPIPYGLFRSSAIGKEEAGRVGRGIGRSRRRRFTEKAAGEGRPGTGMLWGEVRSGPGLRGRIRPPDRGRGHQDTLLAHISGLYDGFSPGFPYLGGMSARIAAPRMEKPRLKVAAGSVGIAGEQTGIVLSKVPEGGG